MELCVRRRKAALTPNGRKDYEKSCFRLANMLAERAQLSADDVLLDVGCGLGDSTMFFAPKVRRATGRVLRPFTFFCGGSLSALVRSLR